MGTSEYDVIVIGGGPAGYVAAIKAARLGGKTALVEKDEVGGTCLNRGCIPTKTFLKTAEVIHEIACAGERGIAIADPRVKLDMPLAVREKNKVVKKLTGGVASLLKANGVDVFKGTGKLLEGRRVEVSGGAPAILGGKKIILAGGSKVSELPIPGLDLPGVLTSTEILDIENVPEHLAIIGGGVIGVEMAMIFGSFGSKITIVEMADRILPFMDEEVSSLLHKILAGRGAEIFTGVGLSKIEKEKAGLALNLGNGRTIKAGSVLVSIGRTGDLSCLGDSGVKTERGKILVNEFMETSVPGVFAPGDINGKKMLAHGAFKMGEAAAANAVNAIKRPGAPLEKPDLRFVPSVVYSFPEAAAVGLTQDEAEKEGDVAVGKFPLSANGKALAAGAPEGFVKVLADKKYGRILGVHIVGPGASEIINEAAALMAMEITVHELAEIIHGHPTISEALMEAAADSLGKCIHLPPKKR